MNVSCNKSIFECFRHLRLFRLFSYVIIFSLADPIEGPFLVFGPNWEICKTVLKPSMGKILFNSHSRASSSGCATGCESSTQISPVSIEADRPAMLVYYYYNYSAGWSVFSTKTMRLFALDFYEVIRPHQLSPHRNHKLII